MPVCIDQILADHPNTACSNTTHTLQVNKHQSANTPNRPIEKYCRDQFATDSILFSNTVQQETCYTSPVITNAAGTDVNVAAA